MSFWKWRRANIGDHLHWPDQIVDPEDGTSPAVTDSNQVGVVVNRANDFTSDWIMLDAGKPVCLYYRKIAVTAFDLDGETWGSQAVDNGPALLNWRLDNEVSEDGEAWTGGQSGYSGPSENPMAAVVNLGVAVRFQRWRVQLILVEDSDPGPSVSDVTRLYDGANDPSVTFDLHVALS